MDTNTGIIKCYTPDELARVIASGQRLIQVDESKMTEKQRINMAVSLHDTRSALGRELHAARSKYMPHVGAKQLAKQQRRASV